MIKKIQKGFTIAEVLIALAIIGIIGAILIPQINTNIFKSKSAGMAANAAKQISTGCQNMIQQANNNAENTSMYETFSTITRADLFGPSTNNPKLELKSDNILVQGKAFFGTESLSNAENAAYINLIKEYGNHTMSETTTHVRNGFSKYKNTKTGVYYMFHPRTSYDGNENENSIIAFIAIDVNGANKPNKAGTDIFLYGLTDRCNMIPAGTKVFKEEALSATGMNVPTEEEGCADNITSGLSCTSRMVREGKIAY